MEQAVGAFYDQIAETYDSTHAGYSEACWSAVLKLLPEIQGRWVLDAGCGTGVMTERLADDVGSWGQVVGVDVSDRMLDVARRRLSDRRNILLHKASIAQVPGRDRSFDVVVCLNVLRHVHDLGAVVREWRRVLKSGGDVLALDWDGGAWPFRIAHPVLRWTNPEYVKARQAAQVEKELQLNGFSITLSERARIARWTPVWIIGAKKD